MPKDPAAAPWRREAGIWFIMVIFALNVADRQLVAVAAESIKSDLELSDTQLGLLTGIAFAVLYCGLGLPLARIADRGDRVRLIAASAAVWSAFTALCGTVQSFWQLALSRIGVGAGEAGFGPAAISLVSDYFGPGDRGRALAVLQIGGPVGVIAAFVIGGYFIEHHGWRWAFVTFAVLGLLLALMALLLLVEPRRAGLAQASHPDLGFRTAARELLQDRAVRLLLVGASFAAFALFGQLAWTPAAFERLFGWTPVQTGALIGAVLGVGGAVGAWLGGYLGSSMYSRSKGGYAYVASGAIILGGPLASLAFLAPVGSTAALALAIPVACLTAWQAPLSAAIQNIVPDDRRALAASLSIISINLVGLGLGSFAIGVTSDLLSPSLGKESLRGGLMLLAPAGAVAAIAFWRAGALIARRSDSQAVSSAHRSLNDTTGERN